MNVNWNTIGFLAAVAIWGGLAMVFAWRPLRDGLHSLARRPKWFLAPFLALCVAAVIDADKTNSPPRMLLRRIVSAGRTVTSEDVARGYAFDFVTNDITYGFAMPSNAAYVGNLHLHGANSCFGNGQIDFGSWSFPFGTGNKLYSSVWWFIDGKIRAAPRDSSLEIATGLGDSLAVQGESRLWLATGDEDERVITWERFFPGGDTNAPANAQIVLCPNGDFATRSNDVLNVYSRIEPFDWDGDGLENSVDPEPLVAGEDAHGTNAEWYNVVCSNVFEAVEGGGAMGSSRPTVYPRSDDVNTNAYYFIDVVSEGRLAPIYFMGDRDSRLGNPVVVARGGETNHVPLLIGIDYAITSPAPFAVSYPVDYTYLELETNTLCNVHIRWPLDFVFTESLEGSSRVYAVTVEPYDPGGILTWEGGGMRSGTSSACGCGCLACYGYSVCFSCSAVCTCHGECQAVGVYAFEDALFAVTGGVCRCGFDDPVEVEATNSLPLSVSFSSHAVIYEDAYEDSPGVTKPKRSTRVRITVDAYGGEHGGVLSLSSLNLGKLTPVGSGVTLPSNLALAAEELFHSTGVYEGASESGSENDVTVSGTFTECVTAQQHQSSDTLTVVKVRISPHVTAPENYALGRHEYGVCELVRCNQYPSAPTVTWNSIGGGSNTVDSLGRPCYKFPLFACENPLRVELGDVQYVPRLSCIEPSGIVARDVDLCTYGLPAGKAGGIGLLQAFYVKPFKVSFSEIAVEEVPCTNGTANGYFRYAFTSNFWSHTVDAGAGKWFDVFPDNHMGDAQYRDEAALAVEMLPITPDGTLTNDYSFGWMEGSMTWEVPFGWNVKGTTNGTEPFGMFGGTTQEFCIEPSGFTGVRKFHNQATRHVNDARYLNWKRIYNNEVRSP